jgi:hypothetical protein
LYQRLYKPFGLPLVAALSIANAPNHNRICQDACLSNCSDRFPGGQKRMSSATSPERDSARIAIQPLLRKASHTSRATGNLDKRRRADDSDTDAGRKTAVGRS